MYGPSTPRHVWFLIENRKLMYATSAVAKDVYIFLMKQIAATRIVSRAMVLA
jgi:hypothetical protein